MQSLCDRVTLFRYILNNNNNSSNNNKNNNSVVEALTCMSTHPLRTRLAILAFSVFFVLNPRKSNNDNNDNDNE